MSRCVVVVVVDLKQTPGDDPQKRKICAWKVDHLGIFSSWVYFAIAMVGWVRAVIEVVVE